MAASDIDDAIALLEAQIKAAAVSGGRTSAGGIDGASVTKRSIGDLVADLTALKKLRAASEPYEIVSRLVP